MFSSKKQIIKNKNNFFSNSRMIINNIFFIINDFIEEIVFSFMFYFNLIKYIIFI